MQVGLDQDLKGIADLLGVSQILGPGLEVAERLEPLKEASSKKGWGFLVFRRHIKNQKEYRLPFKFKKQAEE